MVFQNNVLIEGRLTEKPEIKFTTNGKKYVRFSICRNENKKLEVPDSNGNQWSSTAHFFNVMVWEKIAEKVISLNKGDSVSVIGKLKFSEWVDKEGSKKNTVFIQASDVRKFEILKKEIQENDITEEIDNSEDIIF